MLNPLATVPNKIAQGMGLLAARRNACLAARPAPSIPAPSSRDSATHSELVTTISTKIVAIAGPAAAAPSSAVSSGTPMNPVLGNAATKAPSDASFQPITPRLVIKTVAVTMVSAQNK